MPERKLKLEPGLKNRLNHTLASELQLWTKPNPEPRIEPSLSTSSDLSLPLVLIWSKPGLSQSKPGLGLPLI